MGFIEAYKMALKSILSNKGRSFLTMLGVIIGVGAVISAVAYAQGTTSNITESISSMGTNLVQINIIGRGSNRNVTYSQLKEFAESNKTNINAVIPIITTGGVTVKYGSDTMNTTTMLGTTPEYSEVNNRGVTSGRFLLSYDVDYYQRVAVIGTAVANKLCGGADPVGKSIKINGYIFKVVGVLEQIEGGSTGTADDYIITPITIAQRISKMSVIRNFSVQAASADSVDTVVALIEDFLYSIYKNENAYRVISSEQMLETLNEVTGAMTAMLGGIAAISLAVGGIGIMNIMLVSVTERTREIGIRKAVGAKKRNIMVQFLIEAVMITGLGGIFGILAGICVIKFIYGGFNIVPETYSLFWMLLSFGISLAVGVIFGMFPAVKAANMHPIEALRYP